LIKILYQYQVNDVQVFQPLDTPTFPKYDEDISHNIEKRTKLGNLILQRILMKMGENHVIITEMGRDNFVKTVNDILLRPIAKLSSSDKQYERIIKETLKKVFDSTTLYEFKAICKTTVNSVEENMKRKMFNNIIVSVNIELSEVFSKFTDTEKKNIIWKIKKLLPFIYLSDQEHFINKFEKIVEQLKTSKNYDEMLGVLDIVEKTLSNKK